MTTSLPQGVYTALVTPITSAGDLDLDAFRGLVDWQRQHGVAEHQEQVGARSAAGQR